MRGRHRAGRGAHPAGRLVAALALALVALGAATPGVAAQDEADDVELELLAASTGVDPGGTFALSVAVDGMDGSEDLRVAIHDRVRSRSELERTFGGEGLRGVLHEQVAPLGTLPVDEGGGHRAVVPLAEGTPAGDAVRTPGVYPVVVDARGADGDRAARLVTHLVLRPPPSDLAPPLDVAVVARIGSEPVPHGRPPLADRARAAASAIAAAVTAVPEVTVTLAPVPDTLAALAESPDPADQELLDGLRAAAASTPVLALPYAPTSPDALAAARLDRELAAHLALGGAVQREVLGVAPTQATWLAGPHLGGDGLELLAAHGVRRVVVDPEQVDLLTGAVLTPAGPFEVAPPTRRDRDRDADAEGAVLDALAADARLREVLATRRVEPALLANRVLADLAMLWFERPGTARAAVVPIGTSVDGGVLRPLLEGLRAPTLFRTVALDDAFSDAEPLTTRGGSVLRREVTADEELELDDEVRRGIAEVRADQASVEGMVGPDSPVLRGLERHALRASALGLGRDQRRAELAAAVDAVEALAAQVTTPEKAAITLTAREGRVPLTIRNDTGAPVQVRVRLTSPRLELPGGDTLSLTLEEATNRLDIDVRTRASGSFPFEVEVTSPDGRLLLATTRYSVRSTAVSGVGIVLSAGAGLFLIAWWARHWREARRSTKLVDEDSARPEPG